ncbi:Delta(7)-sterol-C5(6)-desaturase 1 [Tetrabaena socialis]|uniref:Delta(7)-sterol-C5(6)-desaturase 1 n=1 Tax=Tetrabaena socialis TaxID=47790 RepID=A0A2J7ZQF5_9CHLO|nr:Delta(7)-sterol-C5(6)-desaturase 1 [Tetrabaena socialis]|eukprot:PNH02499.1 Delta(7)-sterol-C5(6)-desaturase 1 [Tetrabaena socialis]
MNTLGRALAFVAVFGFVLVSSHLLTDHKPLEGLHVKPSTLVVAGPPGALLSGLRQWFQSFATMADMPQEERQRLILEENVWKNDLVMWMFPDSLRQQMPHFWQTWLRCWILCAAVYFGVGAAWCYYTYFCFGDKLFAPGTIPAFKDVAEQMRVSGSAEAGSKGLLHYDHHKYNKEHTLSPFAGLAFHPLDGILQAVPYAWTLLYCPMHFLTHEILLFATGVWTANIHDNIHGRVWPVMGARYHTIHHTTYKHNYGHYFVFMDWLMGTLTTPEQYEVDVKARAAAVAVSATATATVAASGAEKKAQ